MVDSGFYANKIILAPMVRAVFRVLALKYGADLVYTEEIIDQKLLGSKRLINDLLGTIDYTYENDVVLRGTSDEQRAINVIKKIGKDVAAIDINMGCPKPFSLAGGMGAALLRNVEKTREIVKACVLTSTIPISCKIRVLDKREDTLEFVKMLERSGVSAIGIHGRRKNERQGDANRLDEIHEIARSISIPIIAKIDINCTVPNCSGFSNSVNSNADIVKIWKESGASSVMLARKALSNPSIFRSDGVLSMEEEICDFIKMACKYDENFTATKYVIQRILGSRQETDQRGRETVLAANVLEICKAWSLVHVYESLNGSRWRALHRPKLEFDSETGINFIDITFPPKRLRDRNGAVTPKCVLNSFCDEMRIKRPIYQCKSREVDKKHEAIIEVGGKKFASRIGQPNKKVAEQVAALAALFGLGERERLPGSWEES
ncbi:unnamed protein product [Thelazia callipaeda]|uniref:DRBM domain-containing protein n=1 Tax=Thelazia callipaeda TaxID=103827 RepID=A0A0N5D1D4_THECL|nr:unnamed protein product [Thelazia callipaeda]